EGIRLNNIGAGADVFAVDLAHEISRDQIQLVIGAIDVDAFCIEHRPHGAVENVCAIGIEKLLEGLHKYLTHAQAVSTACGSGRVTPGQATTHLLPQVVLTSLPENKNPAPN